MTNVNWDIDLDTPSEASEDSVVIEEVIEWQLEDEGYLEFLVKTSDGEVIIDRSDLMDGGKVQRMVLAHEKRIPPPWQFCPCGGEDPECEECVCDECDRRCRFLHGRNYGCEKHPVV